ncbi:hypothetical protein [Turicibacter sanguinis]|uniref:hypothetical protein n=1 Tax=Turicibacter sanguinis TaxID=154288 RepID=UPI0018A8AF30|nr:hypothetical protein [Turicibacter sanguinis]MDB8552518.1 hypothetical protein [Turicibacter sanguinis]
MEIDNFDTDTLKGEAIDVLKALKDNFNFTQVDITHFSAISYLILFNVSIYPQLKKHRN